jgi:tRNA nucleotidyltransferase (CCA-adding enzyme)
MRAMVEEGEVDALVAERVWQELSRGLMEQKPSRMFEVLRDCGALARILPELDTGAHLMPVIDYAAQQRFELPVRFAA